MRIPFIATLAFVGTLLSGGFAFAEDYSVDVGTDTKAGRDAGTFTCRFDDRCVAKIESLGLRLVLDVYHYDRFARIRLESTTESGCCYFDYGASSKIIDPRNSLSKLTFFRGIPSGSAHLVENERVGTLYLKFHFRSSTDQ